MPFDAYESDFTRGDYETFSDHMDEIDGEFRDADDCDFDGDREFVTSYQDGSYEGRPAVKFIEVQQGTFECEDEEEVAAVAEQHVVYLKDQISERDLLSENFAELTELDPDRMCDTGERSLVEVVSTIKRKDNGAILAQISHQVLGLHIVEKTEIPQEEEEAH